MTRAGADSVQEQCVCMLFLRAVCSSIRPTVNAELHPIPLNDLLDTVMIGFSSSSQYSKAAHLLRNK